MPLWAIENEDEAGEGLFIVDAPNRDAAMKMFRIKEAGGGHKIHVTDCYQTKWISLAEVRGERGETYYFNRRCERVE